MVAYDYILMLLTANQVLSGTRQLIKYIVNIKNEEIMQMNNTLKNSTKISGSLSFQKE